MPIIRAEHYPREALRQWLIDNGVRWAIPIEEPIVIRGNIAECNAMCVRMDGSGSNTYGERRGWRKRIADGHMDAFDIFKRRRLRFRVRFPLSNYLNG